MKFRASQNDPPIEVTPDRLRVLIKEGLPPPAEVRANEAAAWTRVSDYEASGSSASALTATERDVGHSLHGDAAGRTSRRDEAADDEVDRWERDTRQRKRLGQLVLAFGLGLMAIAILVFSLARLDEIATKLFALVCASGLGSVIGGIKLLVPKSNVVADAVDDDWDNKAKRR